MKKEIVSELEQEELASIICTAIKKRAYPWSKEQVKALADKGYITDDSARYIEEQIIRRDEGWF